MLSQPLLQDKQMTMYQSLRDIMIHSLPGTLLSAFMLTNSLTDGGESKNGQLE